MRLQDITGISPDKRSFRTSSRFVDPSCRVGIEIELENVAFNSGRLSLWNTEHDGSLRNDGVEFISVPVFGEDIHIALTELASALMAYNITDRCGLHIHVDVTDLTVEQLLSFCVAYALIEKPLFDFIGKDRYNNNFCLPLVGAEYIIQFMADIKSNNDREVNRALNSGLKYMAFNIAPVARQGTVEFRHAKSSMDIAHIEQWINIIQHIRKVAMETPAAAFTSMPMEEAAKTILGPFYSTVFPLGTVVNDLKQGWIIAKDLLNIRNITRNRDRVYNKYVETCSISKQEIAEGEEVPVEVTADEWYIPGAFINGATSSTESQRLHAERLERIRRELDDFYGIEGENN